MVSLVFIGLLSFMMQALKQEDRSLELSANENPFIFIVARFRVARAYYLRIGLSQASPPQLSKTLSLQSAVGQAEVG